MRLAWLRSREVLSADLARCPPPAPATAGGAGLWFAAVVGVALYGAVVLNGLGGYYGGFAWLNGARLGLPPELWANVTFLGDARVPMVLLLLFARRDPALLWASFVAALAATLLCQGLKYGYDLPRPPAVLAEGTFELIGPPLHGRSFPSGHSATVFTLATLGVWRATRTWTRSAILAAALLIAASRVVVGVHWPIDVLVGAAVGVVGSWAGIALARRWRWGLRVGGHLFVVRLYAIAAMLLAVLWDTGRETRLLALTLGILGLQVTILQYVVTPTVRRALAARAAAALRGPVAPQ